MRRVLRLQRGAMTTAADAAAARRLQRAAAVPAQLAAAACRTNRIPYTPSMMQENTIEAIFPREGRLPENTVQLTEAANSNTGYLTHEAFA